jgi:asparagine synthase (glutamine-hydrolysing)
MSGIVGIINLDGAPVDRDLLGRMTDFMAFRGPDAQEIWIDGNVGFGHTMLRTTWEAETEKQPLTLDGRVWLTADARIDGRAELIAELEGKLRRRLRVESRSNGHGLPSNGQGSDARVPNDAELILYAYEAWGEDCLRHLLGDFAFAIWDSRQRQLFCARDHFGVKPFYYAWSGNVFIFSNTLNCIRQHPDVSDELNDLAIADFLLFGFNNDPATTSFAKIDRLPSAHYLDVKEGSIDLRRYWSLEVGEPRRYKRTAEYVDHFREIAELAVADRLRTNRVGIKMSGGVDSTTVAAIASNVIRREALSCELRAFTVVYDSVIPDEERHYSQRAATALNIPIDYFVADAYLPFERLDQPQLLRPEPHDLALLALPFDADGRVVNYSRAVLGGKGGDCLRLRLRSYLKSRIKNCEIRRLISEYGLYVARFWERPSLQLSRSLKLRLGITQYPRPYEFPQWIKPNLIERFDLKNRWNLEWQRDTADTHAQLANAGWAGEFEACDPGVSLKQLEYRQPLFDLRLIEFLLAVPPVPFWLDKGLLRAYTKGTLPADVRRRRKTVLAGDPVKEYLKTKEAAWIDAFEATPLLKRYVTPSQIPNVSIGNHGQVDESNVHEYYLHLHPLFLNYWLKQFEPNIGPGMENITWRFTDEKRHAASR